MFRKTPQGRISFSSTIYMMENLRMIYKTCVSLIVKKCFPWDATVSLKHQTDHFRLPRNLSRQPNTIIPICSEMEKKSVWTLRELILVRIRSRERNKIFISSPPLVCHIHFTPLLSRERAEMHEIFQNACRARAVNTTPAGKAGRTGCEARAEVLFPPGRYSLLCALHLRLLRCSSVIYCHFMSLE
mgnify:CR=1 FL=1